jgi:glycine betaine/proline transport system substrate-binding protein
MAPSARFGAVSDATCRHLNLRFVFMRLRILTAAAGVLVAGVLGSASHAADKIRIGEPNWFSGKVAAMVMAEIFSTRFGIESEIFPGSNAMIYDGMKDGSIDLHADSWQPGHADWTGASVAAGDMALSTTTYEGRIGMCVPRYTAEKHDIKTIADLKRPGVAALFDPDGDGVSEVWVGAEGWQMAAAYEVRLRDYGLEPAYRALIEPEPEYQKTLYAGFETRRDMLFACYEPISWFAMEHIAYVAEPPFTDAGHTLVMPSEGADWKARSSITVGERVADVTVAHVTSLNTRFPEAATFMSRFGLTNDDMTEFMFMSDIKGIALDEVVRDWVKFNKARIDAWAGG